MGSSSLLTGAPVVWSSSCACSTSAAACDVPTGAVPSGLDTLACSPAAIRSTSSELKPKNVLPSGNVIPEALPVLGSVNVAFYLLSFGSTSDGCIDV